MTLKPGDIVRWKADAEVGVKRYTPGPYRVVLVESGNIQLRHLDGKVVQFTNNFTKALVDHHLVDMRLLELDPFLDAVDKAKL